MEPFGHTLIIMRLQCSSLAKLRNNVDWNWIPRSAVTVVGKPKTETQFVSQSFVVLSVEMFEMGIALC